MRFLDTKRPVHSLVYFFPALFHCVWSQSVLSYNITVLHGSRIQPSLSLTSFNTSCLCSLSVCFSGKVAPPPLLFSLSTLWNVVLSVILPCNCDTSSSVRRCCDAHLTSSGSIQSRLHSHPQRHYAHPSSSPHHPASSPHPLHIPIPLVFPPFILQLWENTQA